MVLSAIEQVAIIQTDGTVNIGRQALRDTLYATQDFDGITGNLNCNEFGDCAAQNSIAIFQVQNGEFVDLQAMAGGTTKTESITSAAIPTATPITTPMCSGVVGGHAFDGGLLLGCENFVFYAFYPDHHIETVVMTEAESRANQKTHCGAGSDNPNLEWGFNLAFCKAKEQYGKSLGNAQPYVEDLNITFSDGVINFNGEFGLQKFTVVGDKWDFAQ
jgi:hypothetical protein